MKELESQLDLDGITVTGETVRHNLSEARATDCEVIRTLQNPVSNASIAVLWGNLAPRGAILKTSAASARLTTHQGSAVAFENYGDMLARIEDPELNVTPDSVLVLKNCGPRGVPGMPEWGAIPIPAKLQKAGVTDMVRISDARMSGTSYGTVVLHLCPEAAAGGPLAVVRTGDEIRLDVNAGRLDLLLPDAEIEARMKTLTLPRSEHLRGYPRLYIDHVLQASDGCDFDFLRPKNTAELRFVHPVVGRS